MTRTLTDITNIDARAQKMIYFSLVWPLALAILWAIALTWIQHKIKISQFFAPFYLMIAVVPVVLAIFYTTFGLAENLTYENGAWIIGICFVVSFVFDFVKRYFSSIGSPFTPRKKIKRTLKKRRV
jgi:predicted neutral ceramidase superfamily lipid hydrolase